MEDKPNIACEGCGLVLVRAGAVVRAAAWHVWNYSTGRRVGVELECRACGARAHTEARAVFDYVVRCLRGVYGDEARAWTRAYSERVAACAAALETKCDERI